MLDAIELQLGQGILSVLIGLLGAGEIGLSLFLYIFGTITECKACRESKEKVAEFRNKMGYTFPMGLDTTQAIFKKYATNYIPRNFLVDREGKVVKASVGYDDAEFAALVKLIEKEIKK